MHTVMSRNKNWYC